MPKRLHENGPAMPQGDGGGLPTSGVVLDQMRGSLGATKIESKVPRPSGGFGGRRGGTGRMRGR